MKTSTSNKDMTTKIINELREEVKKEIEECKEGITNNIAKGYSYDGWNIELRKAEAKLKMLKNCTKAFQEMIDKSPCVSELHNSHPCKNHDKIINADILKSELKEVSNG